MTGCARSSPARSCRWSPTVLERERRGERGLTREELRALRDKAKESGFFGVQTPEEYGGMALGAVMTALIEAELGRSFVPFSFGGDADNILYAANDEQKERYLLSRRSTARRSAASRSPSPAPGRTRATSGPPPSATATSG